MVSSPDAIRSALAASASALFEATPFLVAGIFLSAAFRGGRLVECLGCGCGHGPSARSLPAAAATWLVFGPFVAFARYAAALAVERALHRSAARDATFPAIRLNLLQDLSAVLPAALVAGAAVQAASSFDIGKLSPFADALVGVALGFTAAPCGIGAVAIAGALHVRAPIAATTFLCVAGIVDLRALRPMPAARIEGDALAYALLALALAIVAWRHGDALVHPAFVIPLFCCACIATLGVVASRQQRCSPARLAPALMLAGALLGAPVPEYRATETTLSRSLRGRTTHLYRRFGRNRRRRHASPVCNHLLSGRRNAGRRAARSTAALRVGHVAACGRHNRSSQRGVSSASAEDRTCPGSERSVRLSLTREGYDKFPFVRGSSSSTGIPLGSSTNAIARVPLGDL